MDDSVFAILALALLILLGPWVYITVVRRRMSRYQRDAEERWAGQQARLRSLESTVENLRRTIGRLEQDSSAPAASASIQESPHVAIVPPPAPAPKPEAAAQVKTPAATPVPFRAQEPGKNVPAAAPPPPRPPQAPSLASIGAGAEAASRAKNRRAGLEETVGTNWLNKLGIVILVLGVAFFLAYQLQTLGPLGKVVVGFSCSAVLLGAGIFFERNERYRLLARAGIGGGWALLFFTTYAMYHVPAARVIASQGTDLVLMLAVAAAMVWHTLRYNSQVVTGLAFLLALTTVTISRVSVYSLSAGVVLALGLVAVALWRGWFELEIFGILASYLNHYFWLRPIIEPMGAHHREFPEFSASAVILILYWAIFRVSYIVRRAGRRAQDESISTLAALLNSGLFLLVMKYQSAHPEWAFRFLLALGAVEIALGQLPVARRRRIPFAVLTTIGATLMMGAIPFRYSGEPLSVLWIVESEALFLAGLWTRDAVFRWLGMLATIPLAAQMVFLEAKRASVAPDPKLGMVFVLAAVMFYANTEGFGRRYRELFTHRFEQEFLRGLSATAAIMALLAAWVALHDAWVGAAWSAIGLLLALVASRRKVASLSMQANLFALAAMARVLLVNVEMSGAFHRVGLRLISVSMVIALLYVSAPWAAVSEAQKKARLPAIYTWAGSFLAGLLLWYELRPVSVALGWAMLGLVLFELGLTLPNTALRLEGYTALAASFARLFFANLNATARAGELSPRLYTVLPLALAYFYVYLRLEGRGEDAPARDRALRAAAWQCYFGVIALAAMARFELNPDWVIGAWAGMALILTALAWRSGRRIFLHQGLLLSLAVLFRTILHNFSEGSYFPASGWNSRTACVGAAALLLCAALPLAFRLKKPERDRESRILPLRVLAALERHPEQALFFIPLAMVTVLLALEMPSGLVTVAWGVEGVAVFLVALWLGERSFRLAGLGLLLLCVGKILVVDVWRLGQRDRYLTFIVLGCALLLVSFLYSRYRETVRQYL